MFYKKYCRYTDCIFKGQTKFTVTAPKYTWQKKQCISLLLLLIFRSFSLPMAFSQTQRKQVLRENVRGVPCPWHVLPNGGEGTLSCPGGCPLSWLEGGGIPESCVPGVPPGRDIGPQTEAPPRRDMEPDWGTLQKGHGTREWDPFPGKDLGPESGKGTGNLTGVPRLPGGEQTENVTFLQGEKGK